MSQGWEDRAHQWIAWSRRPNFDAYWAYRETFLDEMLSAPGRATLEVGCGEGRITRDLATKGHYVTAIDASPTLIASALALDGKSNYVLALAEELPFPDHSFDLVVAYNSLMDVRDMPRAVREASRILTDGGQFAICITHPVCDAGSFADFSSNSPFTIEGSYRGERVLEAVVERGGLKMDFSGGHASDLESYARAFEEAGLLIQRLREPGPDLTAGVEQPGLDRGQRIPYFLMLRLVKAGHPVI